MGKCILAKTKCYLIGGIEFQNGKDWRNYFKEKVKELEIICFDPYQKPFVNDTDETEDVQSTLKQLRQEKKYDKLSKLMKSIRITDLRLTDIVEFIVCYIDLDKITVGTWEEFFWANRLKKPIFLVIKQGKQSAPLWLFGTIPHKYIYNNIDEVINMLKLIDNGKVKIDSNRWKLLKKELR